MHKHAAIKDEVAYRAAKLIEKHGWTQGVFCTPDNKLCIVGALGFAFNEDEPDASDTYYTDISVELADKTFDAIKKLGFLKHKTLDDYKRNSYTTIFDWNDHCGTCEEDILEVLYEMAYTQ